MVVLPEELTAMSLVLFPDDSIVTFPVIRGRINGDVPGVAPGPSAVTFPLLFPDHQL